MIPGVYFQAPFLVYSLVCSPYARDQIVPSTGWFLEMISTVGGRQMWLFAEKTSLTATSIENNQEGNVDISPSSNSCLVEMIRIKQWNLTWYETHSIFFSYIYSSPLQIHYFLFTVQLKGCCHLPFPLLLTLEISALVLLVVNLTMTLNLWYG